MISITSVSISGSLLILVSIISIVSSVVIQYPPSSCFAGGGVVDATPPEFHKRVVRMRNTAHDTAAFFNKTAIDMPNKRIEAVAGGRVRQTP
jgi:hypothetical protein